MLDLKRQVFMWVLTWFGLHVASQQSPCRNIEQNDDRVVLMQLQTRRPWNLLQTVKCIFPAVKASSNTAPTSIKAGSACQSSESSKCCKAQRDIQLAAAQNAYLLRTLSQPHTPVLNGPPLQMPFPNSAKPLLTPSALSMAVHSVTLYVRVAVLAAASSAGVAVGFVCGANTCMACHAW